MRKTKFTPGPWAAAIYSDRPIPMYRIENHQGCPVADVFCGDDASLFLASLDLYEACEAALVELQFYTEWETVAKLEAALKKARGE